MHTVTSHKPYKETFSLSLHISRRFHNFTKYNEMFFIALIATNGVLKKEKEKKSQHFKSKKKKKDKLDSRYFNSAKVVHISLP